MSEREPGWYWVRREKHWDAEPRYYGGKYWGIPSESGHLFEDKDLAVIHEQRILAPGEADPNGVYVRVRPNERIVIEAGPDGVWTESHEMTVPIGLSAIVDEDDAGLGQR